MIEKTNKLIAVLSKVVDVLKFFVTGYAKTVERTEKISGKIITIARIAVLSIVTCGLGFIVYKTIQMITAKKAFKAAENEQEIVVENTNNDYHFVVNNEELDNDENQS